MFDKIKELSKETALYGLSTFLARFLNFFLVPFYTNIFPPSEYGIVANVYAYIAVMNIILLYGMDSAFLKTATSIPKEQQKTVFSTAWRGILFSSLIIGLLLTVFRGSVLDTVSLKDAQTDIYFYALGILIFDNLGAIQFIQLRIDQKPFLFSLIRSANIVVNITLNFILILYADFGIEAVFVSNLAASVFSFCVVSFFTREYFTWHFDVEVFKKMAKFALPYLPAGLASSFLQVIDRPIVEKILGLEALGIYQANYRLGIFMMLFVSMFQFAWQPFFLKNAKSEEAPVLVGRIFTIFSLIGVFILVFFTFFITDILAVSIGGVSLLGKQYTSAAGIVPIILAAYLWNGFYIFFNVGILLREKSTIVPLFVGIAAVIKIMINVLFLKSIGIYVAAWATFAAYAFLALSFYFYSRNTFPIAFEKKKLTLLFITAGVFIVGITIAEQTTLIYKAGIFMLFPLALVLFGFLRPHELKRIKQIFKR